MTLVAAGEKPLNSYPQSDRLWLGLEEGVIRPAAYEQFRMEGEGFVSLLAKDGQKLQKGEQWATLDPEQLDIERRSFELEKSKQEQALKKGREDLEDARLSLSLDLHELERKRDDLANVAGDASIPPVLRRRAEEAVSKMDERIAATRVKLSSESKERDVRLLEEESELQMVRKQRQLLTLEKRSCLVAEFDGELRIADSIKEKLAELSPGELPWVKGGEVIGSITNDRSYEIFVTASGPLFAELPQEELLVFLQDPQTGGLLAGEFARTEETDNGREIVRTYVFTVRETDAERARKSMGTRCLIHVYRKFPGKFRVVYKKDIAFAAPEVLENAGWDGLVRHLWPGSKVIQVGPQTIAVDPKHED